jgi:hypothetical protein
LLGAALPEPRIQFRYWRAEAPRLSCGMGTPGYTLSCEATGQDKPFEVFLTPADVKYLRKHFSSRVE